MPAQPGPEQAAAELEERFTQSGWCKRQCMIAEPAAMGDLAYRQIGQNYGKTENNVQQFAWYYKKEIAGERARFYARLKLLCNGEKQYRVKVLTEIIDDMNERWSSSLRSVIAWISGSLRISLCGMTTTQLSVVFESSKPASSARSKRSPTLKPAVHAKRPKWMWTSYSTPLARDAKEPISEVATA